MKKCILIFFVLLCFVITAAWYFIIYQDIDFVNNPALLVEINKTGTVVLDTYEGRIAGTLKGVVWKNDKYFLDQADDLITQAMCDKVDFAVDDGNKIRIWYITNNGTKYLNDELNRIETIKE